MGRKRKEVVCSEVEQLQEEEEGRKRGSKQPFQQHGEQCGLLSCSAVARSVCAWLGEFSAHARGNGALG